MSRIPHVPILLHPTEARGGEPDPFMTLLIETARRNLGAPDVAQAMVPLPAAGGWCAPAEPLGCGCSVDVLETGVHEPGCTVLDIPTASGESKG